MTLEQCDVYTSSSLDPEPKKNFSGGGAGPKPADIGEFFLRAYDPKTGAKKWEYPVVTPTAEGWAGTVSTAGGVVFFGRRSGATGSRRRTQRRTPLAFRNGGRIDGFTDHVRGGREAVRRHRIGHGDLLVRVVRAGGACTGAKDQNSINREGPYCFGG
jgi:hypothetical protein